MHSTPQDVLTNVNSNSTCILPYFKTLCPIYLENERYLLCRSLKNRYNTIDLSLYLYIFCLILFIYSTKNKKILIIEI